MAPTESISGHSALYVEQFGFSADFARPAQAEEAPLPPEPAPGNEQLTSQKVRWLAIGKAVVSGAQLVAGITQKAAATAADAAHGLLESPTYLIHQKLIAEDSDEMYGAEPRQSRFVWWTQLKRKMFKDSAGLERFNYGLISVPAMGAVALAGVSLAENVGKVINGHTEQGGMDGWDILHVGATGTALALALGLLRSASAMQRTVDSMPSPALRLKQRVHEFKEHARIDAWTTATSLTEAFLHIWGNPHALVLANAGLVYLAGKLGWRFRPWRAGKRADYDHHDHVHAHDDHHDHTACGHLYQVPKTTVVTEKLGRIAGFAGGLVGKGQLLLQRRQEAKSFRREQEHELRWWRWIVRVSESEDPLAPWAGRQLQSIPGETLKMLIRHD